MPLPINANEAYRRIIKRGERPGGRNALSTLTPDDQFEADVAYWYGTLKRAGTPQKSRMLRRLWAIIWHGGLWMRPGLSGAWKAWKHTNMPVASCLSHGGRVLIQLTRDLGNEQVWEWLWGEMPHERRAAGTHGVRFGHFGVLPDGRPKAIAETSKGQKNTHFGVNIAGGGLNNINPVSGTRIQADGRHGHLYICYIAPTDETRGALLVGAEDTAPIDRARVLPNQVVGGILGNTILLPLSFIDLATGGGTHHQPWSPGLRSIFPKGQTGAYHALGVSGKYSLTGSKKFKKLAKLPNLMLNTPNGNDQMFINPPVAIWQDLLNKRRRFDRNNLGHAPPARAEGRAHVMPTKKRFRNETSGGKTHRRHNLLRQLDQILEQIETSGSDAERQLTLDFWRVGQDYLTNANDSQAVKDKVRPFVALADTLTD